MVYGRLRELLADPKIVAVGEIGLDYHWDVEAHDLQIACFRKQIGLALECGKPIIVHSRSAAQDTLRVIEDMYGPGRPAAKVSRAEAERSLAPEEYSTVPGKEWVWRHEKTPGPGCHVAAKGIIHAYAYSLEQARIYTGLGFLIGVGGGFVGSFGGIGRLGGVVYGGVGGIARGLAGGEGARQQE
jgi:Tat protein secretion system quality control protein TatD with DNase activity